MGGLRPITPDAFGLNPHCHLITLLVSVSESGSQNFPIYYECGVQNLKKNKTKNRKIKICRTKNSVQNIGHLMGRKQKFRRF